MKVKINKYCRIYFDIFKRTAMDELKTHPINNLADGKLLLVSHAHSKTSRGRESGGAGRETLNSLGSVRSTNSMRHLDGIQKPLYTLCYIMSFQLKKFMRMF